jgi:hypothetical protein
MKILYALALASMLSACAKSETEPTDCRQEIAGLYQGSGGQNGGTITLQVSPEGSYNSVTTVYLIELPNLFALVSETLSGYLMNNCDQLISESQRTSYNNQSSSTADLIIVGDSIKGTAFINAGQFLINVGKQP